MSFPEKSIEAALMARISATVTTVPVYGFWKPESTAGTEKLTKKSGVFVTVEPKRADTPTLPAYSVGVGIMLLMALADDKSGTRTAEIGEKVLSLVDDWHNGDSAELAALAAALSGTGYSISGIEDTAGGDCGFDNGERCWYVSKQLTVRFIRSAA